MTISIAAECLLADRNESCIVLCTDWETSSVFGNAESHFKQRWIYGQWYGLPSGQELDILALVTLLKSHFKAEAKIDETNVTAIIRNALRVRKNEKADALIGAKYGLTYADFISVGKDKFPPELYRDALSEISSLSLRAEFVIAGFYGNRPFLCNQQRRRHLAENRFRGSRRRRSFGDIGLIVSRSDGRPRSGDNPLFRLRGEEICSTCSRRGTRNHDFDP